MVLIKLVEPSRNFPRQFHMCDLIFPDGNEVALIKQNVSGLQHWISEKSVGAQVFLGDILALLLVSRYALQPAERRNHRKQKVKLSVLRHVRLNEHGATLGVESGGQPIEQYFNGILLDLRSVGVIGRQRVPVGDKEETLVLLLHAHPVLQSANIVAKMQLAG